MLFGPERTTARISIQPTPVTLGDQIEENKPITASVQSKERVLTV
jgi:hypothetical protein